ncbi:unnamed protein product [Blepharisma stoltei]|uniref:Uncharacterized protein n=1 Tax=Blepharisma stoltei TaxID=1481888 RepID=A0AAU9JNG6_9CILI|nr:unnamed protein product [Blepharisma stoltei]
MSGALNPQNIIKCSTNQDAFPQVTQKSSHPFKIFPDDKIHESDWEGGIDFFRLLDVANKFNKFETDSNASTRETASKESRNEKQKESEGKINLAGSETAAGEESKIKKKRCRGKSNFRVKPAKKSRISQEESQNYDSTNVKFESNYPINMKRQDLYEIMKKFEQRIEENGVSTLTHPLLKHLKPCLIRDFRSVCKNHEKIKRTKNNFYDLHVLTYCLTYHDEDFKKLNIKVPGSRFKSYNSDCLKCLFDSKYIRTAFYCYLEIVFKDNNYSGSFYNFSCCEELNHSELCCEKWRRFKEILQDIFAGDQEDTKNFLLLAYTDTDRLLSIGNNSS